MKGQGLDETQILGQNLEETQIVGGVEDPETLMVEGPEGASPSRMTDAAQLVADPNAETQVH